MSAKARDYLDLVRLPNLFTAAADSLAGFLYVGGAISDFGTWGRLGVTSALLYAGGVALNDVCDVEQDRRERPQRPIPSGRISRTNALRLSVVLLVLGIIWATTISMERGVIASAIGACIIAYDVLLKATRSAPVVMGLCRALNLALGLGLNQSLADRGHWIPLALMLVYVASVTFVARKEAQLNRRRRVIAGTIGIGLAVAGLLLLPVGDENPRFLRACIILLATWLVSTGGNAALDPQPLAIQAAVRRFVIAIIFFDACLAWLGGGAIAGAMVALLCVPAAVLARRLRIT